MMSLEFLFPNWLWALSFILIPIIVHLFNFRKYKVVYFTNVHLLREVKKDTQSRTQLKELLILLARILFIAFLVLAFAQPVWVDKEKQKDYSGLFDLTIVLDNSFSMSAEGREGGLLEMAKLKAMDIVNAYPASTSIRILSTDRFGEQLFKSKEESYTSISQIKISPFTYSLDNFFNFFKDINSENKKQHHLYVISDFQKTSTPFINKLDTNYKLYLIPLEQQAHKNILIDTAYFQSPIHNLFTDEQLVFRLRNWGKEDLMDYKVELFINDSLKSILSVNLKSGESILDTFNFKNIASGLKRGRISISDFPITFDNDLYFNYTIKQNLNVGVYSDTPSNTYLDAFFRDNPHYRSHYFDINNLDLMAWNRADVIILNIASTLSTGMQEQISKHVNKGKPLIVFANEDSDKNSKMWQRLGFGFSPIDSVQKQAASINLNSELFKNSFSIQKGELDLPYLNASYSILNYNEWLLKNKKDEVLVALKREKNKNILIFSSPVNERNRTFYTHPVFIPLMYNFMSDIQKYPLYYFVNTNNTMFLDCNNSSADDVFYIKKGEMQIIPEQYAVYSGVKIHIPNHIEAGYYPILNKYGQENGFSMNYNRKESLQDFYSLNELYDLSSRFPNIQIFKGSQINTSSVVQNISYKKDLWYYSILIAILFLLMELLLILFWRD